MHTRTQTSTACLAGLLVLAGAALLMGAAPTATAAYGVYCDPTNATHVRCTAEAGSIKESVCNKGFVGVGCIGEDG